MTTVYSASALKPWQIWVAGSLRSANENWIPLCTHSSFYSVGLTCFCSVHWLFAFCFECQVESFENVFLVLTCFICAVEVYAFTFAPKLWHCCFIVLV